MHIKGGMKSLKIEAHLVVDHTKRKINTEMLASCESACVMASHLPVRC